MNVLDEIRDLFASSNKGKALPITLIDNKFPAWVIRLNESYGVAIEIENDVEINERFSNVKIQTNNYSIGGTEKKMLLLTSSMEHLRNEFASLCTLFVNPGHAGLERKQLIQDPHKWWMGLIELIGNTTSLPSVHSILGEMLTYLYLVKENINPKWIGLFNGTVDFESPEVNYEVKSSTIKFETTVSINSQFQLITNKKVYLIFCRLEESDFGVSIDDIKYNLVRSGVKPEIIEEALRAASLEDNSLNRKKKFKILEMRKYPIDSQFPVINNESFINSKMPDHIMKITYTVNLEGLEYESIDLSFVD